jgi:hypothetical protein
MYGHKLERKKGESAGMFPNPWSKRSMLEADPHGSDPAFSGSGVKHSSCVDRYYNEDSDSERLLQSRQLPQAARLSFMADFTAARTGST